MTEANEKWAKDPERLGAKQYRNTPVLSLD